MQKKIERALQTAVAGLVSSVDPLPPVRVQKTRDARHGDYACNIALLLAKHVRRPPLEVAEDLAARLRNADVPGVTEIVVAAPGFINFLVEKAAKQDIVAAILSQGTAFGLRNPAKRERVHIEFVSANPTGPLHVGHGRHAAYGMSTTNLLRAAGYDVHAEYYVNDAGRQMDILALSIWLRYLQSFGEQVDFPEKGYRGEYVKAIAAALRQKYDDQFLRSADAIFDADLAETAEPTAEEVEATTARAKRRKQQIDVGELMAQLKRERYLDALIAKVKRLLGAQEYDIVHDFGVAQVLQDIRQDLQEFGVRFDRWFSEKTLFTDDEVARALDTLKQRDLLYDQDGATWFKSSRFGDEQDRVLVRDNGQTTYFTADIAYHFSKVERGFKRAIDVLGADHHGYIPRIKAALNAFGIEALQFDTPVVQFAVLFRGKQKVQMSTRSGEFVTLRQLRQEIGNDAARFFYVMAKESQHMDFDLELAKSRSQDNPVYYIQYAHARICSVLRQVSDLESELERGLQTLDRLNATHEHRLLDRLAAYEETLAQAAAKLEPHRLAHYLRELAGALHGYYNAEQFLVEDEAIRHARLCLITATRQVIANGLALLGVSAPETM